MLEQQSLWAFVCDLMMMKQGSSFLVDELSDAQICTRTRTPTHTHTHTHTLRRAVEGNPSDSGALCDYAQFLVDELSDRDGAEKLFLKAVEVCPHDPDALCALGTFL